MIRLRLVFMGLLTARLFPIGCGKDPDATGEVGIGAPGKVDPSIPVVSDAEAYKAQLKREVLELKQTQTR